MKNYEENFAYANQPIISDIKKETRNKEFFTGIVSFVIGAVIVWFLIGLIQSNENNPNFIDQLLDPGADSIIMNIVIAFVIAVISMIFVNTSNQKIEVLAKDFALTIYLPDTISALEKTFIVSSAFKKQLKEMFEEDEWYDKEFLTETWISLDEVGETLLTKNGERYFLKKFKTTTAGFVFTMRKIDPDGIIEQVGTKFILDPEV